MSKWPKMLAAGTVTIGPDGTVDITGFDFVNCGCREAAQLGMAWAVEKLGVALVEDMTADYPKLSGLG